MQKNKIKISGPETVNEIQMREINRRNELLKFLEDNNIPSDKKIYISSKMTGVTGFNAAAFFRMAQDLHDGGYKFVYNPATIGLKFGYNQTWEFYMNEALKMLLECDVLLMFGKYEDSRGCWYERRVARATGKTILKWDRW